MPSYYPSVCGDCKYCRTLPNDPDYEDGQECMENSPNFKTEDGCYRYEQAD